VYAHLVVVRHYWVLRRNRPWSLIVNGVFEPFLYLLSIGLGIGQIVSTFRNDGHVVTDYAAFVAPALLATSAMNSAVNEMTTVVWMRLRFEKVYDAIVTTPMTSSDIALGEVAAAVARSSLAATCFLVVISALRMVHSWWALLAIPGSVLIAFAFSAAGLAVVTLIRQPHHHQYLQLFMLPMFLFATTFYPLTVYPLPLQWIVVCLPLYHSTEVLRALCLGQIGPHFYVSVAYLVVFGAVSLWWGRRRLERLLIH